MSRRGSLVAAASMVALALTLASVQPATGTGGSWSAPVAMPRAGFVFDSHVGSDSTGAVTVAWEVMPGWPDAGIWVRHRSPLGKWGKSENVDPLASHWLAMDEDPAGNVCLLYARRHHGFVPTATCAGPDGVFSPPATLSGRTPYTDYHLVVDDHGTWTAAWTQRDPAGHLRIAAARRVAGVWTAPSLVSDRREVVGDLDLDTSPEGVVVLAWAAHPRGQHDAPWRIHARVREPGVAWGPETTVSGPGAEMPAVAGGPGDRAQVVWVSTRDGAQRLQQRTHTPTGWGRSRTVVASPRGQSRIWAGSVATGGRGTIVVTWERVRTDTVRGGIYAQVCQRDRCGPRQALSPRNGASDPPTAVVNHEGVVWVLWQWKLRARVMGDGWTLQGRVHESAGGWSTRADVSAPDVVDLFPASATLLPTGLPAIAWTSSFPQLNYAYSAMYSEAR
ncbi:hypothetical protein [Nocardioides cynanchi]|uniref:hypothetical protein n=1 Tax=Nocardioides cynanchi TaxID=2558918 RepID=UPI001245B6FA|nr:hypothetical protein [Nocardioides cynanchi]